MLDKSPVFVAVDKWKKKKNKKCKKNPIRHPCTVHDFDKANLGGQETKGKINYTKATPLMHTGMGVSPHYSSVWTVCLKYKTLTCVWTYKIQDSCKLIVLPLYFKNVYQGKKIIAVKNLPQSRLSCSMNIFQAVLLRCINKCCLW